MWLARLILLGVWVVGPVFWRFNACGAGLPSSAPRHFDAMPGSNTLMVARDAVRAWRADGHRDDPATVELSPGRYTLTVPLTFDSRDGNATWMTHNRESVTISGGQSISGWTVDRIWRAKSGLRFEQLYVNGRRATRSRLPEHGFFHLASVQAEDLPDGRAHITVRLPAAEAGSLLANATTFQGAQILVFHKWDTSRYTVSSVDAASGTITVDGARMTSWNPWNNESRFILDNCNVAKSLASGSWHLDGQGSLSYSPRPGESPDSADVVAPVTGKLVEIHGANHLHFDGLQFLHAGYELPPKGCPPVQAAAAIGAAVEVDDSRGVTFEHCEIAHTGTYGIWFRQGCRDCRIEHCLLEDLGAGGIRIGEMAIGDDASTQTEGIVADNNIIRGCGRIHPSAVAVWIGQSANNRITHNDISDLFYTGISVGWTWGYGRSLATNNYIGFNRIHQIGQGALSDMGGIYTLGVSPGSAEIGNVIYDVRAHDYGGWGIYPDEGSTGWTIESNLVWNCTCVNPHSGGGFHQHYGATNYLANNIFALSSGPPMQATRVENHLSFTLERNLIVSSNTEFFTGPWDKIQFASRNNCFVCFDPPKHLFPNGDFVAWQNAGHDAGSILTNLEFIGAWPNIRLSAQSPAAGVGFKMFDPETAGVYGDDEWKQQARVTQARDQGMF